MKQHPAAISALAFVLLTAFAAQAKAADSTRCPVDLAADAPESWQRAAEEVRKLGSTEGECGTVHIVLSETPDETGAELLFATNDGRSARRTIRSPEDLVATVKLLRIAGTKAASPENRPARPEKPPSSRAASSEAKRHTPKDDGRARRHVMALGLHAGARVAGLWSPALAVGAYWIPSALELGLVGIAEPWYSPTGEEETKPPYRAAYGGSAVGGFRFPLGQCEGLVEGRLTLAALSGQRRRPVPTTSTPAPTEDATDTPSAELRTGASLGLVVPRGTSPRLRIDAGGDWVPAGRLAVSASLGVEFGLF